MYLFTITDNYFICIEQLIWFTFNLPLVTLKLSRGNQTTKPAQLKVVISYAVFQRLSKLRPNKRNKTKN